MMRIRHIVLIPLLLLIVGACDFPSDPPLKNRDDPGTPPVIPTTPVDLLPLKARDRWVYVADPFFLPSRSPVSAVAREMMFEDTTYYFLRYSFIPAGQSEERDVFPPLLRNDSTGLWFYSLADPADTLELTGAPVHEYTLPYPALPGTTLTTPDSLYHVRVTAVDTLVNMRSFSSIMLPCIRYDVESRRYPTTVLYVFPGVCILRLENRFGIVHTVAWYLS
ncbi:MAG: hypothetical protein JXA28_14030 [Bacteroidetes bacterium]|nr:hypothetical protein [Bacteroidota bacterium]